MFCTASTRRALLAAALLTAAVAPLASAQHAQASAAAPRASAQLESDPPAAQAALAPQNLILMIADDLGVDMLASYGEGLDLPNTPWLNVMAALGVRFRNAYADPVCTPSRSQILTGRHGFRTGMGWLSEAPGPSLPLTEMLLPEALQQFAPQPYATGAMGKWHLANFNDSGPAHPIFQGFDNHAGSFLNFSGPENYYNWTKYVDGFPQTTTVYATVDTIDSALAWLQTAPEPWLLYVSFNAPHFPYQYPPAGMHNVPQPGPGATSAEIKRAKYKAMIEGMDKQVGRLITGVPFEQLLRTAFIFVGDNGTPDDVTVAPFDPEHAKLTLHEGGCNVPLIISHALLPEMGAWCDALVEVTDLFSTCLELAGADTAAVAASVGELDSISLLPYLIDPDGISLRPTAFSELFQPNGFAPAWSSYGMRDRRFRLIADGQTQTLEFYDLWTDPFEQTDLLKGPPMQPWQQAAFNWLMGELTGLVGPLP